MQQYFIQQQAQICTYFTYSYCIPQDYSIQRRRHNDVNTTANAVSERNCHNNKIAMRVRCMTRSFGKVAGGDAIHDTWFPPKRVRHLFSTPAMLRWTSTQNKRYLKRNYIVSRTGNYLPTTCAIKSLQFTITTRICSQKLQQYAHRINAGGVFSVVATTENTEPAANYR